MNPSKKIIWSIEKETSLSREHGGEINVVSDFLINEYLLMETFASLHNLLNKGNCIVCTHIIKMI